MPHAAMPSRPESRDASAILKPSPSFPRRLPTGTSASSRVNPHVGEERHPILSSFLEAENPGVAVSIKNALIPFGPTSPVRAMSSTTSASAPRVQKTLLPDNRYEPFDK